MRSNKLGAIMPGRLTPVILALVCFFAAHPAQANNGLTSLTCTDNQGRSFTVFFSEKPPTLYFRDSQVPSDRFSISTSEINFNYENKNQEYGVTINRYSGNFIIGTETFPALISGQCERTAKRRF